jgi:Xaa-Pro aminopeptidase
LGGKEKAMKRRPGVRLFVVLFLATTVPSGAALFEKSEYASRRAKLMDKVSDGAAIVWGARSRVEYNEFFQNNDFIYFSGVEIPNAVLVIDGKRRQSSLFFTMTEREARSEGIPEALFKNPKDETGIENVLPLEQFSAYLARLAVDGYVLYTSTKPEELLRECSSQKFNQLFQNQVLENWDGRLTRELRFVQLLNDRFPGLDVRDCANEIWDLRTIKSPAEVDLMRKAARIGVKAHIEMMKATRPGMREYELAALYEYLCKKEGAQDLAYYLIMCSGENHPYVHYHKHDRVLREGDFIVVDVGPDYGYYDIDITISYPANGKFTARQKEVYESCLAVHNACLSLYMPGLSRDELAEAARASLKKQGVDLSKEIFKQRTMQPGFGHYVGLAVHDVGGSPAILKPGMVFANEPYALFPDENLGVRIEDTVVITKSGCEVLTTGIPREIPAIEALMKQPGIIQILKDKGLY